MQEEAATYANRPENWEPDIGNYVIAGLLEIHRTLKRFDKGFRLYGYKNLTLEAYNDYFDVF